MIPSTCNWCWKKLRIPPIEDLEEGEKIIVTTQCCGKKYSIQKKTLMMYKPTCEESD